MNESDFTFSKNEGVDWDALGRVIDSTVGKSSTVKSSSYSVKISFKNDTQLLVSYIAIVNFGSENEKLEMKRRFEKESIDIINDALKIVKKDYKNEADATLKLKEVETDISIEVIGFNPYSPRRTAYFRRKSVFEISA